MSIPKKAPAEPVKEEEPVKEVPATEAPVAAEVPPALDERSAALQALLEKFQEKTEKEVARVLKVCVEANYWFSCCSDGGPLDA